MLIVLVYLVLSCPKTVVVNMTSTWNETDKKTLTLAQSRCKIYYPSSPCLKRFVKKEERTYWAICGKI